MKKIYLLLLLVTLCFHNAIGQNGTIYVDSAIGADIPGNGSLASPFASINYAAQQQAITDTAIYVLQGTYHIQSTILVTKPVAIRNYNGAQVVVDAANWDSTSTGKTMLLIINTSDVTIDGLAFRNCIGPQTNGIWIWNDANSSGPCHNVTVKNCTLSNIGWTGNNLTAVPSQFNNAHALYVLGDSYDPIKDLLLDNNTVSNCATGYSEAVTLQGNIDSFIIQGNEICNISNIGLDIAGNYGYAPIPGIDRARNGDVRHNIIHHCMSPVAMSAGLYLDGAMQVQVYGNQIYENAVGISVGGERLTTEILGLHTIDNNIIYHNAVTGLLLGTGDSNSTNPLVHTHVYNNTFFKNTQGQSINGVTTIDGLPVGSYALYSAEVALHNTDSADFQNNIFYAQPGRRCMLAVDQYAVTGLITNHNNYYREDATPLITIGNNVITFNGLGVTGDFITLPSFISATALESGSVYGDPHFTDTTLGAFSLTDSSAALNMGGAYNIAFSDIVDYAGMPRVYYSIIDAGAFEFQGAPLAISAEVKSHHLPVIYPNPAHGSIAVHLYDDSKYIQASVLDITGREVSTNAGSGSVIYLSLELLTPGTYFIKVLSGGTISFHKVTVL